MILLLRFASIFSGRRRRVQFACIALPNPTKNPPCQRYCLSECVKPDVKEKVQPEGKHTSHQHNLTASRDGHVKDFWFTGGIFVFHRPWRIFSFFPINLCRHTCVFCHFQVGTNDLEKSCISSCILTASSKFWPEWDSSDNSDPSPALHDFNCCGKPSFLDG